MIIDAFPRRKYPCDECPFRCDNTDNPNSQFPAERWAALETTTRDPESGHHPGLNDSMFGCHKGEPGTEADLACAGWLATFGADHVRVRLAVAIGALPAAELQPGENWPQLYATWADVVMHQTSDDDGS